MEKSFYAFGTMNTIRIDDELADNNAYEEHLNQIVKKALSLDDLLSVFKPKSEISILNQNAGKKAVTVSETTMNLLMRSLYYAEISNGAFDITIRPAVKLWGIGQKEQQIPSDLELMKIESLINYKHLELDPISSTAYLKKEGQSVDLGAIAKGYATDFVKNELLLLGVKHGLLNFGGTIFTIGKKREDVPWKIGIQNPIDKRGESIGFLELENKAMVTSAVNERYFIKNGIFYHHILDPVTLKPAKSGVLGVSAVGDCAMDLDAITTALFVLGMEKGIVLANKLDLSVLYLLDNGTVYATKGFTDGTFQFRLTA